MLASISLIFDFFRSIVSKASVTGSHQGADTPTTPVVLAIVVDNARQPHQILSIPNEIVEPELKEAAISDNVLVPQAPQDALDELDHLYEQLLLELHEMQRPLQDIPPIPSQNEPPPLVYHGYELENRTDIFTPILRRKRKSRRTDHSIGFITPLRSSYTSSPRTPALGLSPTSTPGSSPPLTPKQLSSELASMRRKLDILTPSTPLTEQPGFSSPFRPTLSPSTMSKGSPLPPVTSLVSACFTSTTT